MQTVIHEYENLSPIFMQIEHLYAYISDTIHKPLVPHITDISFEDLCDTFKDHIPDFGYISLVDCKYPKLKVPENGNNVIVCLSGGKDSVALAKMLKDCGKKVYLYHVSGINKAYPDEKDAVVDIAHTLGLPYYIDHIVLSGSHRFVEHPMKNMIIANGAIHYGIREGIGTQIAFGNFNESYLEGNEFNVCAGDCMDMWYAYEKIIRSIIPNFTIMIPLNNSQESLKIIEQNRELLPITVSCMSPYRFRDYWRRRTQKKYDVALMNNRCGCCWKCCIEWMYYADRNIFEYNEKYYLHCMQILCDTLRKESKVTGTIQQVWDEYMHYPMTKSKAWEVLKNATIQNGKVKCITAIVK